MYYNIKSFLIARSTKSATVNLLLLNELPYNLNAYSKTYFIVSVG